ncbi:VIT family protein [Weissella viridescens]|uniref:VIT family protein n=1 Tax=Weissella viridescens TaxID=1629 RepID=A0A3P2RKA8_WEIVI|nr:VIT family protein [Weissella viridescens]RRG17868.1 VIT family protein [Weissella viridescens]
MGKLDLAQRNNIMRAAVMGANDGILSISGIVIGVAGATANTFAILIAGFGGALAGTVSMAMGEYVSVHSQNDAQVRAEEEQAQALKTHYQQEFNFVADKYEKLGIKPTLATQATQEMMDQDALGTTVRERHGFTLHHEVSAMGAAIASMISFPLGSVLPMLSIWLLMPQWRIQGTAIAVVIALALTGYTAARFSGVDRWKGTLRNVIAGIFTMLVTFFIGKLMGR